MANSDEYARKLQKELKSYETSVEEEFKGADIDDPAVARKTLNRVLELMPKAQSTMFWLLEHAESETVRAMLAKFIVQVAMDAGKSKQTESDLDKMLSELTGGKSPG